MCKNYKIGNKNFKLINFTNLTWEEQKVILNMRNHEYIKKWMLSSKKIGVKEHLNFIKSLKTNTKNLYFLVKEDEKIIGVIYYQNIDYIEKKSEIGLYKNPFLKERGIGKILLQLILQYAKDVLQLKKLELKVFRLNKKAIHLYKNFGFKSEGIFLYNGKILIKMSYRL